MKKLFILLLLSALVFGCDKHNDDYKNNIPEWHPYVPEEKPEEEEEEYTLEDLNHLLIGGGILDFRLVDRFFQSYMTVDNVDIIKGVVCSPYFDSYDIYLQLDGPTISGGPLKSDPCDPGFNELADKYDDVYGPYDAIESRYVKNKVITHINNIKYDLYVLGNDYDQDHPDGSSLNDITSYFFGKKKRIHIGSKWTETRVASVNYSSLVEYNQSDETLIMVNQPRNILRIPLPAQAGIYSFRVVATSGDNILCDKTIENVELPARKENPFSSGSSN